MGSSGINAVHGECGTEATTDNMKLLLAVSLALLGMAVAEPGYGYYGHGYGHGYGHRYGYGHHGYYGKRSTEAEHGYGYGHHLGYGYGGYGLHGFYGKRSAEPGYGYY